MRLNWVKCFTAAVVLMLMLPNLLMALARRSMRGTGASLLWTVVEKVGLYGSLILMVVPLVNGLEFGFTSTNAFLWWAALMLGLLIAYYVVWNLYMRRGGHAELLTAMKILAGAAFLLTGLFLRAWALTAFSIVYLTACIAIAVEGRR